MSKAIGDSSERTLTEAEKAWTRLIMDFFSMVARRFASLGKGDFAFAERSVGTWIQIILAKLRLCLRKNISQVPSLPVPRTLSAIVDQSLRPERDINKN